MSNSRDPIPGIIYRRPWTPGELSENGRRFTVKRACSGCDELIGDITPTEIDAAVSGEPLPDVTGECPFCTAGPTAEEWAAMGATS